jgi:hypothetical protein
MADKDAPPKFEVPEDVKKQARAGYEIFLARASSRAAPHPEVGKILTCHLLLQHQLNDHIEAVNPNLGKISGLRRLLPIDTLLVLAMGPPDSRNPVVDFLRPGIEEINNMRNVLSHKIASDIAKERLTHVYTTLRYAFPERGEEIDKKSPVEAVQSFTAFACMAMVAWQTSERWGERLKQQALQRADKMEELAQKLFELIDSSTVHEPPSG